MYTWPKVLIILMNLGTNLEKIFLKCLVLSWLPLRKNIEETNPFFPHMKLLYANKLFHSHFSKKLFWNSVLIFIQNLITYQRAKLTVTCGLTAKRQLLTFLSQTGWLFSIKFPFFIHQQICLKDFFF